MVVRSHSYPHGSSSWDASTDLHKEERQYFLLLSKHPPGVGSSLVLGVTSLLGHVVSSTLHQVVLPIIGSSEPK